MVRSPADQIPNQAEPVGSDGLSLTGVLTQLTVALGRIGDQQQAERLRTPKIPYEANHPVLVSPPYQVGNGTIDIPDLLGPHDPYWWDVRRITLNIGAGGLSAGTVNVFRNSVSGGQLATVSFAAPVATFGAQIMLRPRDRLVFVATSVTGNVILDIDAIEIETEWLPEYLT